MTRQRRRVLEVIGEYCYLTTQQVCDLLRSENGPSFDRGMRRLLLLMHRARLLHRARYFDVTRDRPIPVPPYCYWLRKASTEGVGLHAGYERGPYSLAHEVAITEFHIALSRAVVTTSFRLYWRQNNLRRTVNPDALLALSDARLPREQSTRYYFLEIERSRQGHYRDGDSGLLTKLRRYSEYRGTVQCRDDWKHFSDFRVLVVLRNAERETNLLHKLTETLPEPAIWTTAFDTLRFDFSGSHFHSAVDGVPRSLFV